MLFVLHTLMLAVGLLLIQLIVGIILYLDSHNAAKK